ncbi:hypothetical protein F5B22DRAFT_11591 [Xylaria bambusicola]|uniref:uncharacterized protein n=1 Tax=Xylaria bambusicola TaxID=326684 RepID=UPI002007ED25|nr:uncharacterized protein F5B22DRAFT_11591 [Xylaria bambusicola]KAI0527937.1 hypothetical protein F5B22DRAFT_11591 [Xylaria bambusicola]
MESDTWNSNSTSSSRCPHSYEKGVPICWDCAEAGHVASPHETESAANSPAWQRLRRFRKSLGFWDESLRINSIYPAGSQASTLEFRVPEEGLEVAAPNHHRYSQPGLIVVSGPQVVSHEEKFQKPEAKSCSTETIQKEENQQAVVLAPPPAPSPNPAPALSIASEPDQKAWYRRRKFQILVIIAILALVALIIGVAVGVTKQKNSHSSTSLATVDDDQVSSTSPSMSSTGITITETVSLSVPTASSAPSPKTTSAKPSPTSSPSSRVCIGDDGSTYTDPATGDKFRLECAVSHQGQDIENVKTYSMQSCISMCAKNTHCKGAVWYNVGPQGTNLNYCWLKSTMEDPKVDGAVLVTKDAQSVVRL